jgi:predicted transcriptional regulator
MARELSKLSLGEVAEYCGVSTKNIDDMEINASEIPYTLLLKMIDLYMVDVDHLYLGAEFDCC